MAASIVANRKRAGFSATARQRRMGPAPFASFEQDLSDDADSPEERRSAVPQLPGIQEDANSPAIEVAPTNVTVTATLGAGLPGGTSGGGLRTPSTPRIDISRASSSSQHEEEEEGSGDSRASTPEREIFSGQGGLGFKEEGAADLRSSTEELDFHEDATERERRRERLQRRKERGRGSMQPVFKYELEAQSEKERKDSACSLPVSGRTSRLSSVGSAASGASSAASALSVHSRAMSAVSAATSRSPSPHRMLLETSFCGSKPIPTQSIDLDSPCKHETESLEKVLLSRQTDPTKVVMAVECTPSGALPPLPVSPSTKPISLNLSEGGTKMAQSFPAVVETHHAPRSSSAVPSATQQMAAPVRRPPPEDTEPSIMVNGTPEIIKEPLVVAVPEVTRQQHEPTVSASTGASPKPSMHHVVLRKTAEEAKGDRDSRTPSPSTSRKSSFTNLFRRTESPLSPESPTAKRKNVFTAKLKEASDGFRERSRSRSKSSDRGVLDGKNKKDSKNKSVFTSLFKKKTKHSSSSGSVCSSDDVQSPQEAESGMKLTDAIGNVEFTFSSEPIDRRSGVIHERMASEDREERESANVIHISLHGSPPRLPVKTENRQRAKERKPGPNDPIIIPLRSPGTESPPPLVLLPDSPEVPEAVPELPAKTAVEEPPQPPLEELKVKSPVVEAPVEEVLEVVPTPVTPELPQEEEIVEKKEELPPPEQPHTHLSPHHQHLAAMERQNSSDSEMDRSREEPLPSSTMAETGPETEVERKGLVMQDSFEDELPYVPTTLPQERSFAVPIVPIKQRLVPAEVFPIERPRSTTPINPANLEEFVQNPRTGNTPPPESERLRISLPREDSLSSSTTTTTQRNVKSPRRLPGAKSWFEFAETGICGGTEGRRPSVPSPASPPPLPPRSSPPQYSTTPPPPPVKSWINFEEIPEKRKLPKKIQILPSQKSVLEAGAGTDGANVTYSYVKPEDCSCRAELKSRVDAFGLSDEGTVPRRCECHHGPVASGGGAGGGGGAHAQHVRGLHHQDDQTKSTRQHEAATSSSSSRAGAELTPRVDVQDTSGPDRTSIISESSLFEFATSNPYIVQSDGAAGTTGEGLKPMKPFGMDLDVHSNRSSVISQDDCGSPESPPLSGAT